MKQSPFKFQGNNSKQAKGAKNKASAEPDEAKGKQSLSPKDLKKAQIKSRPNVPIRTSRPVNTPRPQAKG